MKKNRKLEIRKKYFPIGGLIVVTLLGAFSFYTIYMTDFFQIRDFEMLYQCFCKDGFQVICGFGLLAYSLYCWILFIENIIFKPKKEILYLYKNNDNETYFLNKKGRKFTYDEDDLEVNKYYSVLKTKDYIYEVLEENKNTINNFQPKEKKRYWFNFYCPIGKFEDLLLLPILYITILPGILSFIMSEGYLKIFALIYSAVPVYLLIYDSIYKIKLRKCEDDLVIDFELSRLHELFKKIGSIIISIIMCIFLLSVFVMLGNYSISRLIFFPFMLGSLLVIGTFLSRVFNANRLNKAFNIVTKVFVILYILILLIFAIISAIKNK